MMNSTKDHFIGYQTTKQIECDNKTTLIIGAVCEEGIVLVGDTKIVDPSRNTFTHENKILLPLQLPIAVGASGLTDLFRRFNRQIPIVVERRQLEIRIANEEKLRTVGRSITEFDIPQESQTAQSSKDLIESPTRPKNEPAIKPPYAYTGENFLTDCKNLIRETAQDGKRFTSNPLEVLLAFSAGGTALFHIDSEGFERQITSYVSIGSGSVYVDMFFKRLWKKHTILDTIALSSFVIKFVQDMELDNFVGVENGKLPQSIVILHDGRWGPLHFENNAEVLSDISEKIKTISKNFETLKIPELVLPKNPPVKT